jgi:hypothetical protein
MSCYYLEINSYVHKKILKFYNIVGSLEEGLEKKPVLCLSLDEMHLPPKGFMWLQNLSDCAALFDEISHTPPGITWPLFPLSSLIWALGFGQSSYHLKFI